MGKIKDYYLQQSVLEKQWLELEKQYEMEVKENESTKIKALQTDKKVG